MTKLYDLADQYRAFNEYVEAALDREDITEDDLEMYIETLNGIQDALENKVENIAKFLKNIESDIKAYKEEEKRLSQKRKYLENKYDGLKSYTQCVLEVYGIDKVKAGKFTARLQNNNPSVEIFDIESIPEEFVIKQEPKVDKKMILDALKLGKNVHGARIAPLTKHLRIN